MESNSVCNRVTGKRESDLFITGVITDRIGRNELLLPSNPKIINSREQKNSQVMKERENLNLDIKKCYWLNKTTTLNVELN